MSRLSLLMVSWPDEAVQLCVDIIDYGKSPLTITWGADVQCSRMPQPQDPTITVAYPAGAVIVRMTVQDVHKPPLSDTLIVNVYADASEATRVGAGAWRLEYNHRRPHGVLGYQAPAVFAARCRPAPGSAALHPPQPGNEEMNGVMVLS